MNTVDRLNEAADLIANDDRPVDALTRAVGDWLRAEVITQQAMPGLLHAMNVAIETTGGPTAYLEIGVREDGEAAMYTSTNEHALAVADEVLRRYGRAPTTRTGPTRP